MILISSFRWEVGGDWTSYYSILKQGENYKNLTLGWSFFFRLVNLVSWKLNLGIFGVNLFIATIYFYSLYKISKTLKLDFFLLTVISFSLVFFTGIMGYVRQELALSFLILAINSLFKNQKKTMLVFFIMAMMTHVSVIIFLLLILYKFRNSLRIITSVTALIFIIFIFTNSINLLSLYEQFIGVGNMRSVGILLRGITLYLCVLIFILNKRKFLSKSKDLNFFFIYNTLLIILFNILFFLIPDFSSIIDRLNFFFVMFQLLIVGRFCSVIIKANNKDYIYYTSFLITLYFIVLYIWLVFGDYSVFYHQYKFLG